jgi:hypothetical protein
MSKLKELHCEGCSWIKQCNNYDRNIQSLRSCQAIFRKKLTARKLERLLPAIIEIYYSPGCKGAYLAEREFQRNMAERNFLEIAKK